MLTDEGMMDAAQRAASAAASMQRSAGWMDETVRKFEMLVADGYGNNVTKLIELLSQEQNLDERCASVMPSKEFPVRCTLPAGHGGPKHGGGGCEWN